MYGFCRLGTMPGAVGGRGRGRERARDEAEHEREEAATPASTGTTHAIELARAAVEPHRERRVAA